MDFVDQQRVAAEDVPILEPSPRDPGRDDDDVPRRRLGGGFTFPVDDTDPQVSCLEDLFGDRSDGERLAGTGAGDDPESLAAARQLPDLGAMFALEQGIDVEAQCELDGLAGRARWRDDDDAAGRRLRRDKRLAVWRQRTICDFAEGSGQRSDSCSGSVEHPGRGRGEWSRVRGERQTPCKFA